MQLVKYIIINLINNYSQKKGVARVQAESFERSQSSKIAGVFDEKGWI